MLKSKKVQIILSSAVMWFISFVCAGASDFVTGVNLGAWLSVSSFLFGFGAVIVLVGYLIVYHGQD